MSALNLHPAPAYGKERSTTLETKSPLPAISGEFSAEKTHYRLSFDRNHHATSSLSSSCHSVQICISLTSHPLTVSVRLKTSLQQ